MFSMTAENHRKVVLLRLTGNVDFADATDLEARLGNELLAPGVKQLILDLSNVGNIDKAGLGAIVSARTLGEGKGRRLVLLAPAPHIKQLMKDADIEGFFPTYDSEEELRGYVPAAND
ncbi:MAG: STAS domain-containing protein [Desulfovibrio sp.]|nr:STAS domain-containing protein [Desulfovibrio sp.]